ncbi:MAG: GIY-YIG nuclease family protein [Synechococcaceae cyanobacterium]|nr:GIY-YIG nuclease family protein [Synechococcaceae cyanobacterium]
MSRQGELFEAAALAASAAPPAAGLPLLRHQLQAWQQRLADHQGPLFAQVAGRLDAAAARQGQLFALPGDEALPESLATSLDPLRLQPQSLSFWRWPEAPQRGAAIYLVLDRPPRLPSALLLYVGETARADRRWKGDHDCKDYLAAYGEALGQAGLEAALSIRFWCDVPAGTRARRALEQALIRFWWPPFNKETRARWQTPFTAATDP